MLALLITLDCVRADHVGPDSGLTPNLDALREEVTLFPNTYSQSQNTLSSHLSMLTSNYLFQHGVYSNFEPKELPSHALPNRLTERGWHCNAFTSVDFLSLLLGSQIGGPDPYYPPAEDRSLRARVMRRLRGRRSPASDTLNAGLRWLDGLPSGSDAFLWLHLFDAHMVYEAPRWYLNRHTFGGAADETVTQQLEEKGWFSPHFPEYEKRLPLEHFPGRYRAAVAYQDAMVGDFVCALKAKGWWEDCFFVLTADHGECLLGDHGVYCAHKKLFDTTVRVPLQVRFPGGKHRGEVVDALVQHVDIAPTAAALAGFEESRYMGRDLAAAAEGGGGHGFAFAEHVNGFLRAARDREVVFVERVPGSENKWGLRMEEGSLFLGDGRPAPEEVRGRAAGLERQMRELLASGASIAEDWGRAAEAEDEVASRLRDLGYM